MGGDPFEQAAQELEQRSTEYEVVQESAPYRGQSVYLSRLTTDFILAVRGMWLAFTRYPESGKWLQHRFTDDFLESALSIWSLANQGIFNAGRREMRYILEAATKYVFVDQQVDGSASLAARIELLSDTSVVPRSSVDPVDQIQFRMVPDAKAFASAVHSAFGSLSGFTHMSSKQLEERLGQAARGEFSGFESVRTLEAFNRLLVQTYDVVLVLLLEGIGPALTGDMFIQVFDEAEDWKIRKGRFVSQISRQFGYKAERNRVSPSDG
jgi:hypothetical protein